MCPFIQTVFPQKLLFILWCCMFAVCGQAVAQKTKSAALAAPVACTPAVKPIIKAAHPFSADAEEIFICKGGSAILEAAIADGYTYEWSNGNTSSKTINVSTAGTYFVTVTDENGCVATSNKIKVKVNSKLQQPVIQTSGPTTVCGSGSVILSVPAVEGASYYWRKDGMVFEKNTTTVTVSEPGVYSIMESNACGQAFSKTSVSFIVDHPVPAFKITADKPLELCVGDSITLTAPTVANATYIWKKDGVAFGGGEPQQRVGEPGRYSLDLKNACGVYASANKLEVRFLPAPVADAGKPQVIETGQSTRLQGSGGTSYSWEPATGLSNPYIADPIASPTTTTTYKLTVTNAAGCEDTAQVTITVEKGLEIPNAFSPNGDGVNDTWEIGKITDFPGVKLEVFNRWGNRIYHNDSYQNEWNGTYRGSIIPVGTYLYVFTFPSKRKVTGYVNVVQ